MSDLILETGTSPGRYLSASITVLPPTVFEGAIRVGVSWRTADGMVAENYRDVAAEALRDGAIDEDRFVALVTEEVAAGARDAYRTMAARR